MNWKNRDFGASLVLDFAVFIAGFLIGMLAIAFVGVSSVTAILGAYIFLAGCATGVAAALIGVLWRRKKKTVVSKDEFYVKN